MPLFEYRCNDCKTGYETLIRGDEEPVCPRCASRNAEKVLSVFAVSHASGASGSACAGGACGLPSQGQGCASGACPFN
jgi:putative FmdB family regulatory protein